MKNSKKLSGLLLSKGIRSSSIFINCGIGSPLIPYFSDNFSNPAVPDLSQFDMLNYFIATMSMNKKKIVGTFCHSNSRICPILNLRNTESIFPGIFFNTWDRRICSLFVPIIARINGSKNKATNKVPIIIMLIFILKEVILLIKMF